MDQRAVYIAKTQRNRGIGLLRFGINFNRGGMTNNRLLSFIQWAAPSGAFAWTQRCVLIKNNSAAKLDFVYVVLQRNMQRKNHKKKSTELQGQHPIDPRRFGNVLRAGWYGGRPLHFSQEHIVAHFGVDGEAEAEDLLFWETPASGLLYSNIITTPCSRKEGLARTRQAHTPTCYRSTVDQSIEWPNPNNLSSGPSVSLACAR